MIGNGFDRQIVVMCLFHAEQIGPVGPLSKHLRPLVDHFVPAALEKRIAA